MSRKKSLCCRHHHHRSPWGKNISSLYSYYSPPLYYFPPPPPPFCVCFFVLDYSFTNLFIPLPPATKKTMELSPPISICHISLILLLQNEDRIFPSRIIQLPIKLLQVGNLPTYNLLMLLEAYSSLSLSHLQLNDTRSVISHLGLIGLTQNLTRIHRRGLEVLIIFLFPTITPPIFRHPCHRLFCLSFPHRHCHLCHAPPPASSAPPLLSSDPASESVGTIPCHP